MLEQHKIITHEGDYGCQNCVRDFWKLSTCNHGNHLVRCTQGKETQNDYLMSEIWYQTEAHLVPCQVPILMDRNLSDLVVSLYHGILSLDWSKPWEKWRGIFRASTTILNGLHLHNTYMKTYCLLQCWGLANTHPKLLSELLMMSKFWCRVLGSYFRLDCWDLHVW